MSKLLILGLLEICWTPFVALQALSCGGGELRSYCWKKPGVTRSARPEADMMIMEPSKHWILDTAEP